MQKDTTILQTIFVHLYCLLVAYYDNSIVIHCGKNALIELLCCFSILTTMQHYCIHMIYVKSF